MAGESGARRAPMVGVAESGPVGFGLVVTINPGRPYIREFLSRVKFILGGLVSSEVLCREVLC